MFVGALDHRLTIANMRVGSTGRKYRFGAGGRELALRLGTAETSLEIREFRAPGASQRVARSLPRYRTLAAYSRKRLSTLPPSSLSSKRPRRLENLYLPNVISFPFVPANTVTYGFPVSRDF
jgi:hypothetical protein